MLQCNILTRFALRRGAPGRDKNSDVDKEFSSCRTNHAFLFNDLWRHYRHPNVDLEPACRLKAPKKKPLTGWQGLFLDMRNRF